MSKNIRPSIDGFIPRRGPKSEGTIKTGLKPSFEESGLSHAADQDDLKGASLKHEHAGGLTRAEIDDSLRSIEDDSKKDKKRRRKNNKKRKLIKRILLAAGLLVLLVGGVIFVKFFIASGNVFKGDLFGFVQAKPLQQDENGFSNVILFGTSEDDDGHDAPYLTDSLMVLSVNQEKKVAYTFSIPRDLWVDYYGMACTAGYQGKINALYQCHSSDGVDEEKGAAALQKKIGEVTGLDIQYYAHVNYSVVREVVKAVDGVTIDIEGSNGAPGIMDSNFDWKCKDGDPYASLATMQKNCPPNGHFIEYPNGPAKLDAEHALYLMMARGAGGASYGLSRSNFDRELNQQKIIVAVKEKALSAGTLTNLSKVTGLIDALGDNLRTNFETAEIRTLMGLAQDIPSDKITSINLVDAEPAIFAIVNRNGQSAVDSVNGFGNYSNVSQYLKKQMTSDPVVREAAKIAVYNGSSVEGKAQEVADDLVAKGFSVADIGNAPKGKYSMYQIYAVGADKPATKAKLESLYGVEISTEEPPVQTVGVDFVIVVGSAV